MPMLADAVAKETLPDAERKTTRPLEDRKTREKSLCGNESPSWSVRWSRHHESDLYLANTGGNVF